MEPEATEPRCLQHNALVTNSLQVGLQRSEQRRAGRCQQPVGHGQQGSAACRMCIQRDAAAGQACTPHATQAAACSASTSIAQHTPARSLCCALRHHGGGGGGRHRSGGQAAKGILPRRQRRCTGGEVEAGYDFKQVEEAAGFKIVLKATGIHSKHVQCSAPQRISAQHSTAQHSTAQTPPLHAAHSPPESPFR